MLLLCALIRNHVPTAAGLASSSSGFARFAARALVERAYPDGTYERYGIVYFRSSGFQGRLRAVFWRFY